MNRIRARLRHRTEEDTADVVQTVILIAGFVLVTLVVIVWLSQAVLNKGVDTANCVEAVRAPSYAGTDGGTEDTCKATNTSGSHSFESSDEYQSRY